jgi:hypothetical protein
MTLAFGFGQDLRRDTPAINQLCTWTAKTPAPAERGRLCFALTLITASEAKDPKIRKLQAGLCSLSNVFSTFLPGR